MKDYIKTVRSGMDVLPWPRQMETLFGEGDHFITHYNFPSGTGPWNSVVYFGGRYSITMQVDIDVDYKTFQVVRATGPAKFYIWEFKSINKSPDGQTSVNYSNGWELNEAQWNKLVEAKGNWSVLGLNVKPVSPLPRWSEYIREWRKSMPEIAR